MITQNSFNRDYFIRFSHCDPAGIVYFPEYLVLSNWLVEDWFNQCLSIDFAECSGSRMLGVPIVKLECEFLKPSRHGEVLTFALSLTKIGRRSIGISITASRGGEIRMRCKQVLVTICLTTGVACEVPGDLRTSLEAFQKTEYVALEGAQ